MVIKSRGFRSGTRKSLHKKRRLRISLTTFMQKFKIGDKVMISPQPVSQKGMPTPRFRGKVAQVLSARGKSYILELKDGGKRKTIISRPEHLKKM